MKKQHLIWVANAMIGIGLGLVIIGLVVMLQGCQPAMTSYDLTEAEKACKDGGGHITDVTPDLVRCEYAK